MVQVADIAASLKEAGGLLLFVDMEDDNLILATSEFAYNHLSPQIGEIDAFVVGDRDTQPTRGYLNRYSQSLQVALPNALIVRKSDMRLLMAQFIERESGDNFLPFIDVAEDPDAVMVDGQ